MPKHNSMRNANSNWDSNRKRNLCQTNWSHHLQKIESFSSWKMFLNYNFILSLSMQSPSASGISQKHTELMASTRIPFDPSQSLFGKRSNELSRIENSNFPILFGDYRSNATPEFESPSYVCPSTKSAQHPEALSMCSSVDTLDNDNPVETCPISIRNKWIFGRDDLNPRSQAVQMEPLLSSHM